MRFEETVEIQTSTFTNFKIPSRLKVLALSVTVINSTRAADFVVGDIKKIVINSFSE